MTNFYMDDLLSGSDTIEECQIDIKSIYSTLEAGKFPLTKWMSNDRLIPLQNDKSYQISLFYILRKKL